MDQNLRGGETAAPYDYRRFDRVWQRLAPGGEDAVPETAPQPAAALPGAEEDPCCMGTAAGEMLEVLEGFIEDEAADFRYYLALAAQAPPWARQTLRGMAADEADHARRLMAVCYLITGRSSCPAVSWDRVYIGGWCPALRERYHAEACGGLNYLRAAEGTTDPCLAKILTRLSEDEYRHAEQLTALLERSLRGGCSR